MVKNTSWPDPGQQDQQGFRQIVTAKCSNLLLFPDGLSLCRQEEASAVCGLLRMQLKTRNVHSCALMNFSILSAILFEGLSPCPGHFYFVGACCHLEMSLRLLLMANCQICCLVGWMPLDEQLNAKIHSSTMYDICVLPGSQ